jgi:4'-phosphopantetheinyl transferase
LPKPTRANPPLAFQLSQAGQPEPWPATPSTLSSKDVHVWTSFLDEGEDAPSVLDDAELRRAERFLLPRPRAEFVRSRTALRRILASYLTCEPASLAFTVGPHGKPALVGGGNLQFNASHSGNCFIVAVRRDQPIGVDVEQHRTVSDVNAIARRFFRSAEADLIAALPEADRAAGFRALWTLKEAVVKAAGEALIHHMDRIEGRLDANGRAQFVAWHGMSCWETFQFTPAPGYTATLATKPPFNKPLLR